MVLTACIEIDSLDPNDFTMNRTTLKNNRQVFLKYSADNIKSKFFNRNLKFVIVYWDPKLLPTIVGNE